MMAALGKYELIEELNSGSMGTVYVARDRVLDRKVALKTVLPGASLDNELKERFYREARACARLQHPGIVTIYDFGEEDGTAYIAMELLVGTDLRRIISERRPLPLDMKLEIGAMVCEGLEHAHSQGIVHRDIKPSNIFVTEDGRAKILDFGIARTAQSSLTMVGRVLGTPNYMAPEQILGKPCDARSDLFSVAIVLFELVAYSHPFQGASIPKRIVREAPDSLKGVCPEAPEELEAILRKALEKKPDQRYSSCQEMAQELRAVAAAVRKQAMGAATEAKANAAELFAPASPAPVAQAPVAGEGTEVLMSRVLTALQEFDEAVEQSNLSKARRAFEDVRAAARGDERFEGAVQRSQERLYELELSAPAEEPARAASETVTGRAAEEAKEPADLEATLFMQRPVIPAAPPPPAPAAPAVTAPPAREEPARPAASGVGDATRLFGGDFPPVGVKPAAPAPPPAPAPAAAAPVRPAEPAKPPATKAAPPAPPKPAPPAAPAPVAAAEARPAAAAVPAPANASSAKMILVVGAVAVVLILAAGAYLLLGRGSSAALLPAVATARVTANSASILASPAAGEAAIVEVKKGETLRVLRAPRSSTQEWVEVQYAPVKKIYPKGYARLSDLGDWTSDKAPVALALLRAFAPAAGASEGEIQQTLEKLNAFTAKFAGAPEEADAHLDIARWNVELARLAVAGGRPIQPFVQAANDSLAKVGGRSDLAGAVHDVQQDLAMLGSSKPGTAPGAAPASGAPGAPSGINIDFAMRKAEAAYENGDYDTALRYLRLVQHDQPANKQAADLMQKVRKAKALETGQQ